MQLRDYLECEEITAADFAKKIDRSEATVSRIIRGLSRPDWGTMQAIRIATDGGVMPNDFAAELPAADEPNEAAA